MRLDFRIDWGYTYLYSRRHYHPVFVWDGSLAVDDGEILECRKLHYPVLIAGPGWCAKETKLEAPCWQSRTRRGLAGVRVVAEVAENAVFTLRTASGEWSFTARQIAEDGRIVFDVGPKYLGCHVVVTRTGYYWFRPEPRPGETVWEAGDLPLPQHEWARMRAGWIAPGQSLALNVEIPETDAEHVEQMLHLEVMASPGHTPDAEGLYRGYFPYRFACDGETVVESRRYLRYHGASMQMQEDLYLRFQAAPGRHTLTFTNLHPANFILVTRAVLTHHPRRHLELSLPRWALVGEKLHGSVFAVRPDRAEIAWPGGGAELDLAPGWNDFPLEFTEPGRNIPVRAGESVGHVDAVYALPEENLPVTVGFDMTTVPHDDTGIMDWILNYTWRTRLGNLVVFRNFIRSSAGRESIPVAPGLMEKWGRYCREYGIYAEAATDFDSGELTRGAGGMLHSVGRHEWPGAVYAFDPQPGCISHDMKEAMERYLAHLKVEIDRAHRAAPRAAFGDASGGHRYCYMAGADFIRSETMVPHTQHLCSQARPAAESLASGEWGVHIAIHHPYQPFFNTHLGMYYLSLMQPWLMGASMLYEEDSLFLLFKEERQSWDDALTKGKRDMTREFFRFVKTHPRTGTVERRIAFLEGRYAAPFNGFICGPEQTPDYSVWGKFGNPAPEWGHRQPEKCRQLLDVLMPGASTQPLRQRFDKRRFFFSGTPYGDFDEVPVEAKTEYFSQYELLLNLGWNTMLAEDCAKLKNFVEQGGILLTGLPQFSTHTRRDFLRDMKDLALYNGGDLNDLCGFTVKGPGPRFCGQWNAADRETYPEPELSALPSASPDEDGECRIAEILPSTAEVVAWDADSALPIVVRNRVGKGFVYTFTMWCYPGHEKFQKTAASFIAKLAAQVQGDIRVHDPSREVFWNVRRMENGAILSLLNTDWTSPGNEKQVTVYTPVTVFPFTVWVKEGHCTFILVLDDCAVEYGEALHAAEFGGGCVTFHGTGKHEITVHRASGDATSTVDFGEETSRTVSL